jgi:hypothetical protein
VTDDPNRPPDEAAEARLALMIQQIDRAVESTYLVAISYQRIIGLEAHEVPRLCVNAACRYVERALEAYHRRKGVQEPAHPLHMSLEERQRRQAELVAMATDLARVLAEGLDVCRQIQGQMAHDGGETTNQTPN